MLIRLQWGGTICAHQQLAYRLTQHLVTGAAKDVLCRSVEGFNAITVIRLSAFLPCGDHHLIVLFTHLKARHLNFTTTLGKRHSVCPVSMSKGFQQSMQIHNLIRFTHQ